MGEWFLGLDSPLLIQGILFGLLLLGAVGFPIPEDLPLVFGGIISHRGNVSVIMTAIVCYSGVLTGDLIIFAIGRKLGPSLFEKEWFKKRMGPHRVKRIRLRLERRSLLMIFIARHLFYLRTVTFLVCGAVRMRWIRFLVADALAALISVPLMIWLGYIFSEQYNALVKFIDEAKLWSLLLAVPILIVLYAIFFRKQKIDHEDRPPF